MVYTLRFYHLQNAVCFIILTYLVPVLFIFYIQGVLKFKKNNSSAKRLSRSTYLWLNSPILFFTTQQHPNTVAPSSLQCVISLFNAPKRQKSNLIWSKECDERPQRRDYHQRHKTWMVFVGWIEYSFGSMSEEADFSWNVMAHGDARVVEVKGKLAMEWVARTLHTTSEHGVSSITTAEAHTSAASSRLNWRPRRFK